MKTRRTFLLLVTAIAAVSAAAPAAANAGGTYVTIKIEGAGRVHETTDQHLIDCSSGPAGVTCPETYYDTNVFKDIVLKAEPAPNWRFDTWSVGGVGGLNCAVNADTCTFRSGICVFCTTHYSATAKFVIRDDDGDGDPRGTDCDDDNKGRYHGAIDVPGNGIDENCDGQDATVPIDLDIDDDGYERNGPGATQPFDCNDNNKNINPGARDIPDNGIDEDCRDGDAVDLDRDGDGYERDEPGAKAPFDCDDDKDGINPGMAEVPDNGVDENCDGIRGVKLDRDGDGYEREEPGAKAPFDCDDADREIRPGAHDIPRNNVDEDCDGKDADYPSITSEVRYAAKSKARFAIIRRLSVIRPPDGAKVELRCRGKGCTFARRREIAAPGTGEIAFGSELRKAKLRRGTVLEVWVTRSQMRGKVVRLTVGRRGKVSGLTLCVLPGSRTPTGCPAA
jgi:hypothetical protein